VFLLIDHERLAPNSSSVGGRRVSPLTMGRSSATRVSSAYDVHLCSPYPVAVLLCALLCGSGTLAVVPLIALTVCHLRLGAVGRTLLE